MWGVIGRLLGLVVFGLGAISGFVEFLSPQSGAQSQWTPGLAVATISLAVLFIGGALREILDRESILATFGMGAAVVFFFSLPVYGGIYLATTIQVEYETASGSATFREVRGDAYSPAARHERYIRGGSIADDELVQTLGSVAAVWTPESILDYWRRTLALYIVVASSLVCTVCFIGAFVDRAAVERIQATESARSSRERARKRAARRRRERDY
jgi:hypothetical protein